MRIRWPWAVVELRLILWKPFKLFLKTFKSITVDNGLNYTKILEPSAPSQQWLLQRDTSHSALIAPLEYFSLKMCHIPGPQAHYESPHSQLSELPCLEATVAKRQIMKWPILKSILTFWEAKQKTDLWSSSQGSSTQLHFRVRWHNVWPLPWK